MYTGTPGSGKSYHMAQRIFNALRNHDINIITNFPVNLDNLALTRIGWIKRQITDRSHGKYRFKHYNHVTLRGRHYYWPDVEVTVPALESFARKNHKRRFGKRLDEAQTLVFLDEAGIIFNSRGYAAAGRDDWTRFFALHRHYMYEFILGCQFDRQIDRQIRSCVEYEYKHRKVKNFRFLGWLIATLAGGNLFLVYESWYATRDKTGVGNDLIRFSPRIASIYDTLGMLADEPDEEAGETDAPPAQEEAGDRGSPPRLAGAAPAPGLLDRLRRKLSGKKGEKNDVEN